MTQHCLHGNVDSNTIPQTVKCHIRGKYLETDLASPSPYTWRLRLQNFCLVTATDVLRVPGHSEFIIRWLP